MSSDEKKRWSKAEFNDLLKDKKDNMSYGDLSKKYNRTIEAIKRKLHRGYADDKRFAQRPEFLQDDKLIEEFKKDYGGPNKINGIKIMEKYNIDTKQNLYKIAKELGVRKNKVL